MRVCAQAVSVTNDPLIIVATTMHRFNSGIYFGIGAPEALSNCKLIEFPQKTLDPLPFLLLPLLTLHTT